MLDHHNRQRMKAAGHIVDEASDEPLNHHLSENFKDYVKAHYRIKDPSVLEIPDVMKMIYACEWYDLPKTAYSDRIAFHPYLTEQDYV